MKLDMLSSYVQSSLEMDNHYINQQNSNHHHQHQHNSSYANNFINSNQNSSNNLVYASFDSLWNQQQQHATGDTGSPTGDTKLFKAFNYEQQQQQHQQQRNNSSESTNNFNANSNQDVSLRKILLILPENPAFKGVHNRIS